LQYLGTIKLRPFVLILFYTFHRYNALQIQFTHTLIIKEMYKVV
jgi:hypothetical protein